MHKKLFIPGPTEVKPEILKELSKPMIGHRSKEFSALFEEIVPKLQKVLYTNNPIILSTSSATGLMEAAVRNCVNKRCLNLMCGAFSDRWHDITLANGKYADQLKVEWGRAILPEIVDERLATGDYDAVTLVHNETSTGVMNPLEEIAKVVKKYPDVMFLVDCVSSMSAVKIDVDKLGIDVCLAGVQKAFALPPGFAVAAVSDRAFEKAKAVPDRGYYFDFLVFMKSIAKKQTPTTPSIPHMYALNTQLDNILTEGLEKRFERHRQMADFVRHWAKKNFALFAQPGYESHTLTVIKNTQNIDVGALNKELQRRGMIIANGYGAIKDMTFRIAHMGDLTLDDIKELTEDIDQILGDTK
jgi:predicted phosphoserine aminotransferase